MLFFHALSTIPLCSPSKFNSALQFFSAFLSKKNALIASSKRLGGWLGGWLAGCWLEFCEISAMGSRRELGVVALDRSWSRGVHQQKFLYQAQLWARPGPKTARKETFDFIFSFCIDMDPNAFPFE